MPRDKYVLCEVDDQGTPIRIFKPQKKAYTFPVEQVNEFPHGFAVGIIRRQVFQRAGCTRIQPGCCEECGATIIWEAGSYNSGEMHEVISKGKGGEVSVDNSKAICRACHTGPNGAHGNRRWHSAKLKEQ